MARMQGKTTSDVSQLFAGIDVSKAHLDLQLSCERGARRFTNDPAGCAAIDAHLRAHSDGADAPCLVALEPTGRDHFPVWRALHTAGHGVAPINPLHVRRFAESDGELAKTDALDASVLARMAAQRSPGAKPPPSEEQLRLKALTTAIADRTDRRAMLKGQRAETRDPLDARLDARLDEVEITRLSDTITTLKAERVRLIGANPKTARVAKILCSVPSIGDASAHWIIADMPEIGTLGEKQAAALLDTAPRANQSRKRDKRCHIKGGRRRLRAALHMPAIVASNANPDLKTFKLLLKAKGKNNAVILTAILRKLIVLANALVAQNRLWTPKCP